MAKMNYERTRIEDLGRRNGYEHYEPDTFRGQGAAAKKKNTYPCLPQPPKPPKVRKPAKVREVFPASQPRVRRGPLRPPVAGAGWDGAGKHAELRRPPVDRA
jgi:hypothetical protein